MFIWPEAIGGILSSSHYSNVFLLAMEHIIYFVTFLVGLAIVAIPTNIWKNNIKSVVINYEVIQKRRRYRNLSIVGFLIIFSSLINFAAELPPSLGRIAETAPQVVSLFGIGVVFASNRAIFDPYFESSFAYELKANGFCLYLRPFDSDSTASFESFMGFRKRSTESMLTEELNKRIAQTYAIGNPGTCLPASHSTFNIYADDKEWKDIVNHMSVSASVILLNVGRTKGCIWEIRNCLKKKLTDRLIVLIEDSDSLQIAKQELGVITRRVNIDEPHLIYLDADSKKWKLKKITSAREIKKNVDEFIQTHTRAGNAAWERQYNRRLNNVFSKSYDPGKFYVVLSFLLNPYATALYYRWPMGLTFLGLFYSIFVFFAPFIFYFMGIPTLAIILLTIILFLPIPIFVPRISSNSHSWGNVCAYKLLSKSFSRWMVVLVLITGLVGVLAESF